MSETACGCKTLTVLVIKASNAYTKESVPVTLPSKLELLRTDLNVEILTSDSSYYSKLKVLELPHFGCKQLGATSKASPCPPTHLLFSFHPLRGLLLVLMSIGFGNPGDS